jgi:hypothetical protein
VSLKRTTTAIAAAALALLPAACGSDDKGEPVPATLREQLNSRLDEAENRLDAEVAGACEDIQNDTEPEVDRVLASLPEDTDADTRQTLEDGFSRLWELVGEECDRLRNQETDTETTPEPTPTTPEETQTETVPTVPEETTPEDTGGEEAPKEEKDGGKGKGTDEQGGVEIPGGGGGGTVAPGAG